MSTFVRSALLTLLVTSAACGEDSPSRGDSLDVIASEYVRLVLALGEHDPGYVDAYYGPALWREMVREEALPVDRIARRARRLSKTADTAPAAPDDLLPLRRRFLARQLTALAARAGSVHSLDGIPAVSPSTKRLLVQAAIALGAIGLALLLVWQPAFRPSDVVRALKFCERRDHERAVCDRTKAFAATSTEIAERLRTAYDVPAEQIFYFPPCVDRSVFRKYTEKETAPAYKYLSEVSGIPADKLRASKLVFETSRVDQTKRKDLLLDAFAFVAREREDAYLFIGGGPENDLFKSLKKGLDEKPELKGRAFLTGFIPDEHIGPLFSMAEVYASASEMEGFGMSVLQAAASGTAVVCSDLVPFAVQYVPEDALIVPAGEVFDFAQAIGNLLDSEPDRSKRALQLAEKVKMLDWDAQAVAFLQYLRRRGFQVVPGKEES